MKKTFWSLAALMLMAAPVMTSCSNDLDEVAPAEEVKENVVTLTIKMPEQAETRVGINNETLKLTGWELGNIVKVYNVGWNGALTIDGPIPFECIDPAGTFSGTLPDGKSLSDYNFAVYGPDLVVCQGYAGFLTKKVSSNLADVTCLAGEISSGSCSMAICNNVLKVTNEGPAVDVAWKYYLDVTPVFYSLYCGFNDENHFARLLSYSISTSFSDNKFTIPSGDSYVLLPPMGSKYNLVNESGDCVVEGHDFSSVAIGKLFTKTISAADPHLLSGDFSVSSTKKVKFTKSNLYWSNTDSKFHFEAKPTDYLETRNQDHVCHFFWTKDKDKSYAATYGDGTNATSDKFFADGSDAEHELTVDGVSGLYVLSAAEWRYLLSNRTNASDLKKPGVTVTDGTNSYTNCLIIAPDDFTGTIAETYTLDDLETAGLVCLPAAGQYYSSVSDVGFGYYWSSSPRADGAGDAQALGFYSGGAHVGNEYRGSGFSLRVVLAE